MVSRILLAYAACSVLSVAWGAMKADRRIVMNITRDKRDQISKVNIFARGYVKAIEFKATGYLKQWNCSGYLDIKQDDAVVDCSLPNESWKVQSVIKCDSMDSFYIDGVNMKCEGDTPVKWASDL